MRRGWRVREEEGANPRARRIIVKVPPATGEVAVAAPSARAITPAIDFARAERDWQREQLPDAVRGLVLEDQARRNSICWGLFLD